MSVWRQPERPRRTDRAAPRRGAELVPAGRLRLDPRSRAGDRRDPRQLPRRRAADRAWRRTSGSRRPDARLSVMEVKWGLIPDMSITRTLPRLVGIDVAKELTYTGRTFSGDRGARARDRHPRRRGSARRGARAGERDRRPVPERRARGQTAVRRGLDRHARADARARGLDPARSGRIAQPARRGDCRALEAARGLHGRMTFGAGYTRGPLRAGSVLRSARHESPSAGWSNRQLARFWPWNSRFESLPRSLPGGCAERVRASRDRSRDRRAARSARRGRSRPRSDAARARDRPSVRPTAPPRRGRPDVPDAELAARRSSRGRSPDPSREAGPTYSSEAQSDRSEKK